METILIVEDDPARLIALAMVLRSYGYTVLESSNEDEAIHNCLEHGRPIRALLMDFELGGNKKGPGIAGRLLDLAPEMQVVFMFSSPPNILLDVGRLPWSCTLLRKPFRPDALAGAVRKLPQDPWVVRTEAAQKAGGKT